LPDPDFASILWLHLIDGLISTETLLKKLDLESRSVDQNRDLIAPHDETGGMEAQSTTSPAADPSMPRGSDDSRPAMMGSEASAHRRDDEIASDAPAFLNRKFGSGLRDVSPGSNILSKLAQRMQEAIGAWRRHLQQDQLPKETGRSGANIERVLLALLSLLVVVSCAGAIAALMQLKSIKSELTALQRELLPLRERVAKLDQTEKSKEAQDKVRDQKTQSSRESRAEEAPLLFSREEIQLIRDYIKPAPVAGPPMATISVGDPVTGPTIPFPSPVTEKLSKLIGATFTIRNGAIIILKKDSRRADAVLGPN
jgi:hypothetical protein